MFKKNSKKLITFGILVSLIYGSEIFAADNPGLENLSATCAEKDEVVFGLFSPTHIPNLNEVSWPGVEETPDYIPADGIRNVRLILCPKEDASYGIKAIDFRLPMHAEIFPFSVAMGNQFKGSGLDDAVFGDAGHLQIIVPDAPNARSGYAIIGKDIGGQKIVFALPWRQENNEMEWIPYGAIWGNFTFGQPFVSTTSYCPAGPKHEGQVVYTIGTAVIKASGCKYDGVGKSVVYDFTHISVVDQNGILPQELRGQEIILTGEDLKSNLETVFSHHNWCDGFRLNVPQLHAQYIDTKVILPNAPLHEGKSFIGRASWYQGSWQIDEELNQVDCAFPVDTDSRTSSLPKN